MKAADALRVVEEMGVDQVVRDIVAAAPHPSAEALDVVRSVMRTASRREVARHAA